ncbi:hypothetical protein L0Y49_03250 [bacterium]|nr:hypothetical protein [bacterium]MCI0565643.1 hypothetical protein [bacterium]
MTIETLILRVNQYIVNPLIFVLFGAALLFFLWGLVQFIMNSESAEARDVGRRHMFYGAIGMFIMVGVFGIMWVLINSFDLELPGGGDYGPFIAPR